VTQLDLFPGFAQPQKPAIIHDQEPPQKFEVIYTDPPWDYDGRTFLDGKAHDTGAASDHYPTMTPQELMELPVKDFLADKCICFMWTTGPQLDISIDVLKAWGFKFKTIAFVWDKVVTNPGYYTMSQTELAIVGTHNAIPTPRGARNVKQFHKEQRGRHSAKPHEFRKRIEQMFPDQTKLEMFQRESKPGWHAWGIDAVGENIVTIPRLENPSLPRNADIPQVMWPIPF
tara:strand:+ start:1275 stop:1961 length:687 start_codon:yes stop_codon:yes gene_type:complete